MINSATGIGIHAIPALHWINKEVVTLISRVFTAFVLLSLPPQALADYWVKIKSNVTGPYTVEGTITSNIPGPIYLSLDLSLRGQKPDDIAVGTTFIRIPYSSDQVSFVLDGRENAIPHNGHLPSGDYDVEVSFYPKWLENRETASSLKIESKVSDSKIITLEASGTVIPD